MVTIQASKLTLNDIHSLLKFQEKFADISFRDLLSLEPITESEQKELVKIRNDFRPYLTAAKASESQVKALTTFPLLRLAGFYSYPVKINVKEGIDNIVIDNEDKTITGRFDIVTVNRERPTVNNIPFWILVIEAKESGVEVRQGLPQLLAYAYKSLQRQSSAWGLATNGLQYLFVYMKAGNPATYQLLPMLDLMYTESAIQLLQTLKAIAFLFES